MFALYENKKTKKRKNIHCHWNAKILHLKINGTLFSTSSWNCVIQYNKDTIVRELLRKQIGLGK